MKVLAVTIAALNYLSFFWSVIGVFRMHTDKDILKYRLLQLNSVLLWMGGIYIISNFAENSLGTYSTITLNFLTLILFWKHSNLVKRNNFTIVFSNDIPSVLVRNGLYKYVRHPFYSIYLVCYFSVNLTAFNMFYFLLCCSMFAIYVIAAKKEERKFSVSNHHKDYENYIKDTGMFIPKIKLKKSA